MTTTLLRDNPNCPVYPSGNGGAVHSMEVER